MGKYGNAPESNVCKITFILGNGFDLNLGMKTKYTDMYFGYMEEPSNSKNIEKFKNVLENQIPFDKWGDFELGMADYAKTLSSEQELVECVRDFKRYLVEHLEREYQRLKNAIFEIQNPSEMTRILSSSLYRFYSGLSKNDINSINRFVNNKSIEINIITFNYTNSLELLLDYSTIPTRSSINAPIHIHGSLDENVVLGVDNQEQLSELPYKLTRNGRRAFIKTYFNEDYDNEKVKKAINTIYESDIICTYGFAMGESDKLWVDTIVAWLQDKPKGHLVCYQYDDNKYYKYNFDEMMEAEDEKKEQLLAKFGIDNELMLSKIHIPVGSNIFDFKEIRKKLEYILEPII